MALTGQFFTVDLMNDIQTQMLNIQSALVAAGYTSPDIITHEISWFTLPTLIRTYFNEQELNTQKIDAITDWVNPYSAVFEWQKQNGMIFNHLNRWWLWAEFNNEIISGQRQKTQFLTDINDELIADVNGEQILVYAGFFGEGVK